MPDTIYNDYLSRPHWGGADADVDIHVERWEGEIDGSFRAMSLFRESGLTNYKQVAHASNTWRGDRVGGIEVKGRRSGEALEQTRIPNEKFIITVDTTSYASSVVDYQDDWTAPDFRASHVFEHGNTHSKAFDTAHIIKLIHAAQWQAPDSLTNFNDGIYDNTSITAWDSGNDFSKDANAIVSAHAKACEKFIERDLGGSLAEFVTLCKPNVFSRLLEHNKLMNVQFSENVGAGNNFVQRRIAVINGIRIIETPRFPTAAITNHILGPSFNVTANEAKVGMLIFHPRHTLITVEAQPMTVRYWDDMGQFANRLDSYTMYTVGVRRGDACCAIQMPTA